jgi:hypothetical protein
LCKGIDHHSSNLPYVHSESLACLLQAAIEPQEGAAPLRSASQYIGVIGMDL